MKLFVVIILSFVIPWIIGICQFSRAKYIIVLAVPFSSSLAFTLNTIGLDLSFFYPTVSSETIMHTVGILGNIGIVPLESCIFIYLTEHTNVKKYILNILLSLVSTIIDLLFIRFKLLAYDNGWNMYWTFIMFFISFYIVYFYYIGVKKVVSLH